MRESYIKQIRNVGVSVSKMVIWYVLFLFGLIAPINTAFGAANLMLTPKRVVFEERTRTAQVILLNTGDEAGSYRISFIRQKMTEDGRFIEVEPDEAGYYADTMVRYSPRQITLSPGQSQVVRLMLRKPRDLKEGEYRSHMLFQSIPQSAKSSLESAIKADEKGISIEIIPVIGISIPVIIRHGKLESSVSLEDARITQTSETNPRPQIALTMHRSGNKSAYGDFRIIFKPNSGGEAITIGLVNGVAVYAPNALRRFVVPLQLPENMELKDGKIHILYLESGKDEKTGLIAEATFSL